MRDYAIFGIISVPQLVAGEMWLFDRISWSNRVTAYLTLCLQEDKADCEKQRLVQAIENNFFVDP